MKKCEQCQREYPDGSEVCEACDLQLGEPISRSPIETPPVAAPPVVEVEDETCPICQAVIQPQWKFCKFCGQRLDETTIVSGRPAEPPPPGNVATPVDVPLPVKTSVHVPPPPATSDWVRPPKFGTREDGFTGAPPIPLAGAAIPIAAETAPPPALPKTKVFTPVRTGAIPSSPPPPFREPRPGADFSAEIAPAFLPWICKTCAHENHAGLEACESCGAPLVPGKKQRERKKTLIIAGLVAGLVFVSTAFAIGLLYFLGSTVTIQTAPGDATVLIDGREAGRTDAAGNLIVKRVRAGAHSLQIKKEGFSDWNQRLSVSLTERQQTLNIKLDPLMWKLTVVSTPPGASVFVDDQPVGTTDFTSGMLDVPKVASGTHIVRVSAPGFLESTQAVNLTGDQKVTFVLAPETAAPSGTPEDAIKTALEGWAAAIRARNLEQVMGFYGETLTAYNEKASVAKATIRSEYTNNFAVFKQMEFQNTNVKVTIDPAGTSATVTLDNTFKYTADGNMTSQGAGPMQLIMTKTGEAWLITSEKKLKGK